MARVDVPTLECDRCKYRTQDEQVMSQFRTLTGMYDKYQGQSEKWDLCFTCWDQFVTFFMGGKLIPSLVFGKVST